MMSEAQRRSAKASQLRKKRKEGKYLSPSENQWLDEYEKLFGNKRGRRPNPLPQLPASSKQNESEQDYSARIGTVDQWGNAKDADIPSLDDAPIPENERTKTEETKTETKTEPLDAEVVDEQKEKDEASAEARAQGKAWADSYCDWLKSVGKECRAMGGFSLPDEIVDTLVHYAASGTFTRYSAQIGEAMSEGTQDIVTLASGAGMFVQRHLLRRKHATKQTQEPEQAPSKEQQSEPSPIRPRGMLSQVF